jgi:hypothetical protein
LPRLSRVVGKRADLIETVEKGAKIFQN